MGMTDTEKDDDDDIIDTDLREECPDNVSDDHGDTHLRGEPEAGQMDLTF